MLPFLKALPSLLKIGKSIGRHLLHRGSKARKRREEELKSSESNYEPYVPDDDSNEHHKVTLIHIHNKPHYKGSDKAHSLRRAFGMDDDEEPKKKKGSGLGSFLKLMSHDDDD